MQTQRRSINFVFPYLIFLLFNLPFASQTLSRLQVEDFVPGSPAGVPAQRDEIAIPAPVAPPTLLDTNFLRDRLAPVLKEAPRLELPSFQEFVAEITDGQADMIRGVYVAGVLALPVIQQPDKNPAFVSEEDGVITQFQQAARYDVTGFLAHNYLSGRLFYQLAPLQEVKVIYGNGSVKNYRVDSIHYFQKMAPSSLRSNLINLDTGEKFTTPEIFANFYRGEHRVTFQTCLEGEGRLNWGLMFVTATPSGSVE